MKLSAPLLERYGAVPVPRYTSYPSANHWEPRDEKFARQVFGRASHRPLSLYVHVPFCHRLCFYCGCTMQVNRRPEHVDRYLAALELELSTVRAAIDSPGEVVQVHFGGGTPTFLSSAQLTQVTSALRRAFKFSRAPEMSIELHPPVTTFEQLATLRELGFERLSLGVQDFDPRVQLRVNRPQPYEQTRALIVEARRLGFQSVNVDLMYGLPSQTVERYRVTLQKVLELKPDRIAVFGYAHLPKLKPHQRLLEGSDLPDARLRLSLLELALTELQEGGYQSIGLDHFALPTDELAKARADGTLRRNFMGYTTCADSEVLAFGPSSISEVGGSFVQNVRDTNGWAARLENDRLPIERGWLSSEEDQRRARLLQSLFCRLQVDRAALDHGELTALEPMIADGLVTVSPTTVQVTAAGQLLLRNIASVFDAYLRAPALRQHAAAV